MEINKDIGVIELIPGYVIHDKIQESYPHVIYRATRKEDGVPVVIKTLVDKYPKKEDLANIRREHQITHHLQFEGVIKVFTLQPYGHGNLAMVMEQFGLSIKDLLAQREHRVLPLEEFYPLALKLVKILGEVHKKKIVHKNLIPSNILIDQISGELRIIDFGSASELTREHLDTISISNRIEGSLPYISPEQTGRMNRDIDYRTDYYSLGVSFFEMLSGKLPFEANDPLEWVHYHISRPPPAPNSINKNIPEALARIVLKLMSKNAEDRYQSSYGLQVDLEKCWEQFKQGVENTSLILGEADVSQVFQIPQKLYGREVELEKLESYFENASHGSVELCLISGSPGVGKTVLVHELGRSIVKKRGYLIQGKFEQFRQNTSYIALANAFRDLMRQLLGESKPRLDNWCHKISEALGANAQLIIDFVPELELIIGKQDSVPDLSPAETQNRFLLLFQNFVKVFAREDHPFVIFLDDLQWSDVPTLNLIHRLVTTQELSHLLIIGTFRDNEVDATHPLNLTLSDIEGKRFIERLSLHPLTEEATNQLTKDTLLHEENQTRELSHLIYEKTGGNPFFTIELLKNLQEREIIFFNIQKRNWDWDSQAVRGIAYSDNVVDILVANQNRLSESTQHVLQLAACIGTTFDLRTLSIIEESTMEKTGAELYEALKANMVKPQNDSYKYVGLEGAEENEMASSLSQDINPVYKFQHDRIQQAAYSRIQPEKRKALHLSIGKLILSHSDEEEIEEVLVNVVDHINKGRNLVDDPGERQKYARLNLSAGIKAKKSSAYESALDYLKIGQELLGESAWEKDYTLAWELSNELQHCFYLTGDRENADVWTEKMLENSQTDIEKGLVLAARTRQYATTGRMQESIEAAYEGLRILGFQFIQNPGSSDVDEQLRLATENLRGRAVPDLINMPEINDQKAKIASQLLMEIFPAAFLSGSGEMFPYMVLKSVNISLCYGNSPETAFSYAAYGMLLCGLYEDASKGYEYGKLGVDMIETFDDITLKSRIIYLYTMFVHHWSNHWSSMTPWFHKGIEAGYQSGDLLYLAYSAQDCIIWDPQLDLETASNEHRKLLAIVKECEYQDSYDSGTLFLQMQLNFQGRTKSKFSLTDDTFDELSCFEGMYHRRFMTGISNYHIYKAEIHLLYNDAEGALEHVTEQEKLMSSVMSLPQLVRIHIVSFLVRSMMLRKVKKLEQDKMLEKMKQSLEKMNTWVKNCPENFEHLRLLMNAELVGFSGNIQEALSYYERSITNANKNNFRRDEAMANEMAARFLLHLHLPKAAEGYLQDAHYLYYRWGALRKVSEMEENYPLLKNAKGYKKENKSLISGEKTNELEGDSLDSDILDISSVLRASQTISGELVLAKLLKATLQILLENAGAQKGFLVENKDGKLTIQAFKSTEEINSDETVSLKDHDGIPVLPITMVNTSLRTNEPIVISNASKINPFSSDPYIKHRMPLSVMCVPLPIHGQWQAAVYLENNLTHSVFTNERVKIVKMLASQASISMENARIYEMQETLLKAQQRFVPIQFLKHLGHKDIAKVELGESVSMEMSVLFSDIRNFTPLVERLSPQAVIELLNRVYSRLGKPIAESGGFIDSYAGDGIMALFAVPAQQAVEAGVNMSKALWQFNKLPDRNIESEIRVGIGVNSGPLVLGTMGANDRMQCSVLGDTVNLASRIEQLTRVYDAQFLISERTYAALQNPEAFSVRMVDCVAVKGKEAAVNLYEVLDAENDERRRAKEATKKTLADGLKAYFNRQFTEAYQLFNAGLQQDPKDAVFSVFVFRAKRYMEAPPPEEWQGYEKLYNKS